jgi:hypothetical protein
MPVVSIGDLAVVTWQASCSRNRCDCVIEIMSMWTLHGKLANGAGKADATFAFCLQRALHK